MKKFFTFAVLLAGIASFAAAQAAPSTSGTASGEASTSASPQTGATQSPSATDPSSQASASATPVYAELNKTVDAKKAKQGDEVVAKTTADVNAGTLNIPKNSKLIGHVAEVQPRGKDEGESRLVIVFDKAVLKGGQEIPIRANIQAVAAPERAPMPSGDMMSPASSPGPTSSGSGSYGGVVGGAAGTPATTGDASGRPAGGVASNAGTTVATGADPGVGATGNTGNVAIDSTSRGVIGMPDVKLQPGAPDGTQGAAFTSSTKNVKLEGGTRMVLLVAAQ